MFVPLEHHDSEPLTSVILHLRDRLAREKDFQESVLWKLRLLESELLQCRRQISSFSEILEVPREILALNRENQMLDDALFAQQEHLKTILAGLEEGDFRSMGEALLNELETELNKDQRNEREGATARILQAYVDTGVRYMGRCQILVTSLTQRIENLENELALSRQEESRLRDTHEMIVRFCRDHGQATYGDFRSHVMSLLGGEMERELKEAVQRIPRM
jgi:hypothetical protein